MTRAPKDVAASVRTRLAQLARDRGDDFQLVLTRYVNERLLYRLATSNHADRFILKGAAVFTLWVGEPHRSTRDLDLLGFGDSSEMRLRQVFVDVLGPAAVDDGVVFDLDGLVVGPIRDDQEYGGVRVTTIARLARAQVRVQIDVGFGDAVTPDAEMVDFPVLLDFPPTRISAGDRDRRKGGGDGAARDGEQPDEGLLRRPPPVGAIHVRGRDAREGNPRDLCATAHFVASPPARRAHACVRR